MSICLSHPLLTFSQQLPAISTEYTIFILPPPLLNHQLWLPPSSLIPRHFFAISQAPMTQNHWFFKCVMLLHVCALAHAAMSARDLPHSILHRDKFPQPWVQSCGKMPQPTAWVRCLCHGLSVSHAPLHCLMCWCITCICVLFSLIIFSIMRYSRLQVLLFPQIYHSAWHIVLKKWIKFFNTNKIHH